MQSNANGLVMCGALANLGYAEDISGALGCFVSPPIAVHLIDVQDRSSCRTVTLY
jgi:hypothetical protein